MLLLLHLSKLLKFSKNKKLVNPSLLAPTHVNMASSFREDLLTTYIYMPTIIYTTTTITTLSTSLIHLTLHLLTVNTVSLLVSYPLLSNSNPHRRIRICDIWHRQQNLPPVSTFLLLNSCVRC